MVSREEHAFLTRHLPYGEGPHDAAEAESLATEPRPNAAKMHRFVVGIDETPRSLSPSEAEGLRDPFAELLLKRGTFPMSLRALLAAFDTFNDDSSGLPVQESYLVAEGGQIPWSLES